MRVENCTQRAGRKYLHVLREHRFHRHGHRVELVADTLRSGLANIRYAKARTLRGKHSAQVITNAADTLHSNAQPLEIGATQTEFHRGLQAQEYAQCGLGSRISTGLPGLAAEAADKTRNSRDLLH